MRFTFLIILFVFLLSSCFRESENDVSLSAINNSVSKWMPFQKDDIITYKNQKGDELKFKVTRKNIEDFENESNINSQKNAFLYGQLLNKNYSESEFTYDFLIYMQQTDNNISSRVTYNVLDCATEFDCFPLSVMNHDVTGQKKQIVDSVVVNNYLYHKVVHLERDTTVNKMNNNSCRVWKMLIAPGYGVIEFCDRSTNDVWILQRN
jgi:hypothetical protein